MADIGDPSYQAEVNSLNSGLLNPAARKRTDNASTIGGNVPLTAAAAREAISPDSSGLRRMDFWPTGVR